MAIHLPAVITRFPFQYFAPCFFIQVIVYSHHGFDVLFRGIPSFTHKRIVKLLW